MRNYELFLREAFMENNPGVILESSNNVVLEKTDKSDVYKENYYMMNNLQIPYGSKVLSKPANRDAIVSFTSKFIDDHSKEFSTSGPVYMVPFGDKDINVLYELFGLNDEIIMNMYNEMIKETYFGKISAFLTGIVKNSPHKLLITCILIEAIQKNYEDIVECCGYIFAFSEYPIILRKFWKTGVKEDVMNYTIEHLGNKFVVKKVKNLLELLKYDADVAISAHREIFKKGVDNSYMDFIYRFRNQMGSKFRKISNAYYDNIDLNATQHNPVTQYDDGQLADQEGHSANVAAIVDKTINKFSSGEINQSFIRVSSDARQVDRSNLAGYISLIYSAKENRIPKFIETIITVYFSKNPTSQSVGSGEFLTFGLSLYRSISTSKDPNLVTLREILDKWMFDIIDIKSQYTRVATIINYTRAIFDYIIFMINYYNN